MCVARRSKQDNAHTHTSFAFVFLLSFCPSPPLYPLSKIDGDLDKRAVIDFFPLLFLFFLRPKRCVLSDSGRNTLSGSFFLCVSLFFSFFQPHADRLRDENTFQKLQFNVCMYTGRTPFVGFSIRLK